MQSKNKIILVMLLTILLSVFVIAISKDPSYNDPDNPSTPGSCAHVGQSCSSVDCCTGTCCNDICCGALQTCSSNKCVSKTPGTGNVWENEIATKITYSQAVKEGDCAFVYKGDNTLFEPVKIGDSVYQSYNEVLLVCNKYEGKISFESSNLNHFSEGRTNLEKTKKDCLTKAADETAKKKCEDDYNYGIGVLEGFYNFINENAKRLDITDASVNLKTSGVNEFEYFYGDVLSSRLKLETGADFNGQFSFGDLGGGYLFNVVAHNGNELGDNAKLRYGCIDLKLFSKIETDNKISSNFIRGFNDLSCNTKPLNFKYSLYNLLILEGVVYDKCLYVNQYDKDGNSKSLCFDGATEKTITKASDCSCYTYFNSENIGTGSCYDGIDNDNDGKIDLQPGKEDVACKCAYAKWKQSKSTQPWEEWFDEKEISELKKPACSDGIDNDGDGMIDNDDNGCWGIKEGESYGCAGKNIVTQFPISVDNVYDPNNYEPCKESEESYPSWVLIPGRCTMAGKGSDEDGDGICSSEDCDDKNPLVKKGSKDICGDGIDQDCSGSDCTAECIWNEYQKCSTTCTNCQGVWTRLPDSMFPHIEGGSAINEGGLYAIAGRTNLGEKWWGIDKYCWLVAWGTTPKPKSTFTIVGQMEKYNFTTGLWETHNEPEKKWVAPDPDYTNWLVVKYDPSQTGGGANEEGNKPLVGNSLENVGDWLYLIAGFGLPAVNAHTLFVIYSFNPEIDWWGRVASIGVDCRTENCGRGVNYGQQNTMYHGSTVIGNKIYVFGGIANAMYGNDELDFKNYDELGLKVNWLSDLFVIDTSKITYYTEKPYTPKFQTLASNGGRAKLQSAPNPRKSPGMFSYNDKVYVVGGRIFNINGRNYASNQKLFHMYDPITNSWTQLQDSIYEHGLDPGIVVKGNKVYVIGGATLNNKKGTTNVEYYDFDQKKWIDVKTINQPEFPIGNGASVQYEGKLYYLSTVGSGISTESNDGKSTLLVFDPESKAEDSTKLYKACSMFNTFSDSPCYEMDTTSTTTICSNGDTKVCGSGVCAKINSTCVSNSWSTCVYNSSINYESSETLCDDLDNDCDGSIDEGCECDEEGDEQDCSLQEGVCEDSTQECNEDLEWDECDYGDDYEEDEESSCSDDLDNDCDGDTDEDDDDCDTTLSSSSSSTCRDGTKNGICSSSKPMKCEKGILAFNCKDCGCPSGKICKEDNTCGTDLSRSEFYGDENTEEEENIYEPTVNYTEEESSGFPWLVFIIIFLIIFAVAGFYYFKLKKGKKIVKEKPKKDLSKVINYIKNARSKGIKDNVIEANLLKARWKKEDIKDSFNSLDGKKFLGIFKIIKGNKTKQAK
ncbi:MAG: MopE-related protein [Candidatus Nanoarchaeia archaeon]|nr:MopE-related protein [Candidatus Nanoarchaeia archaeon]